MRFVNLTQLIPAHDQGTSGSWDPLQPRKMQQAPCVVNLDLVQFIRPTQAGSMVCFGGEDYFEVTETLDEIGRRASAKG